ncbi:hypothetical protein [Salsuginibacillus kocurii]|uniref:hypothetical protein n=1 Tax=Salsuginibacillus kocurii TaxID=427078 RepID=UPI00037D5F76|nr:hypothetical protein [Salsuginibacillus kocurii]
MILRLLIFIALAILVYAVIKYIMNPKRKLELAHERKHFYFYDERKNVRKNFLVTYNGVMFEGEKYLGRTEQAFEVVRISVWSKSNQELKGLAKEDFHFIEQEILSHYPHAEIEWKSPVKELLRT